jgi:hypothetical protein
VTRIEEADESSLFATRASRRARPRSVPSGRAGSRGALRGWAFRNVDARRVARPFETGNAETSRLVLGFPVSSVMIGARANDSSGRDEERGS